MRKFIRWIALFLVLECVSLVSYAGYVFPKQYTFSGEIWKLNYQKQSNDNLIAEYVRNNETVENWTQLFTYQQFDISSRPDMTTIDFAKNMDMVLKEKNYDYKFEMLSTSPKESMLEFKILSPADMQQDEIERIVLRDNGIIVVIHYVIKKQDMGSDARTQWVKNLKSVSILTAAK